MQHSKIQVVEFLESRFFYGNLSCLLIEFYKTLNKIILRVAGMRFLDEITRFKLVAE